MKKYFFGYLFVRIAKLLAIFTVLAGVGYALFKLEQANLAAQSASYQPSQPLRQSLANLSDSLTTSRQMVAAFCEQNGGSAPTFAAVDFGGPLDDDTDFARLATRLGQGDQQRRSLKETLVSRFETLVAGIEAKLRAHAAEIAAATAPPPVSTAPPPAPAQRPTPTPIPAEQADTLYSGQMNNYEIQQRGTALDRGKQLLKVLESSAENAANRQTLTDSVSQLEALTQLLPSKVEAPVTFDLPTQTERAAPALPPRRELNAEKVAEQLARLRGAVRQSLLTAWMLDEKYASTSDLAVAESGRCRLASLAVKGIWLAAFGQVGVALVVAVFVAFLVLVLADFMQTLLDTATNTGVMAGAVNRQ